ncbi:MAG: hypothetical protein ACFB10_05810 [Salibacteraceae bacterium]
MKHLVFTLLFLSWGSSTFCQSDSTYTLPYLQKSTKFASFILGGDLFLLGGGESNYLDNNQLTTTSFAPTLLPRLTIGGLHFCGHANFYVTFPLGFLAVGSTPSVFSELRYRQSVETGARIYPFALKPSSFRPYAGISFRPMYYRHEQKESNFSNGGPFFAKVITPVEFGFTYASGKYLFSASGYYQFTDRFDYYLAPGTLGRVELEPLTFNFGIYRYMDTDRHMRTKKAARNLNLQHEVLEKADRLSTWYWGLGPSAALQMSKSDFLMAFAPHLYDDYVVRFTPDITFGRYFHKPDMNIGLAYRRLGGTSSGFDDEVRMDRNSIMLESYKNLFNWLGFVPFVGATASLEALRLEFNGKSYEEVKPTWGIIAGWDIRVTQTEVSLLRTNLRWTPGLHLEAEGEKVMFDQIEFNFIQYVRFIGRKKAYQEARKQRQSR